MATGGVREMDERALQGFRCMKPMLKLLEHLHAAGTERDRAGNRQWHMDQHIALFLLFMFNPICDSLRALQRASQLKKVQRLLGVPRASLGSLSEANRVFDADLLRALIGELADQLKPLPHDPRLNDLGAILTLVDGTLLSALPKMAWALWTDEKHRALKAHIHYELLTGVPVRGTLTNGRHNEKQVLRSSLEAGLLESILESAPGFRVEIMDDDGVKVEHLLSVFMWNNSPSPYNDCVVKKYKYLRDAAESGRLRVDLSELTHH